MNPINFAEHNNEVREIWRTFWAGNPIKIPVIAGTSDRFFVQNPNTNPRGISFREYTENPDVMFEMQANFDRYKRFHVLGDHMMGYPEEEEGWEVHIDFQNYYEAAWFGCKVEFPEHEVPYAVPLLNENNREMLFEKGLPDPFSGLMARGKEYYERFMERKKTFLLDGYPVSRIQMNWLYGTDGPFTIACELLGPAEMCALIYEEPDYVHQLMDYITEAIIARIKAWRRYLGQPEFSDSFGFADDSILMISKEMYREFVLPYHKKLIRGVSTMKLPGQIHLCGDATRHFVTIRDELNINNFDTGFPVAHGKLVQELGPDVVVAGGPKADLLRVGTPEQIMEEARRIIQEVKPYTKKFILREGNDVPPYTPLENIAALTQARELYGIY